MSILPSFVFKYPKLYDGLRNAMGAYGSKWTARKDGGVRITGKTDLTAFLLRVQCAAEC